MSLGDRKSFFPRSHNKYMRTVSEFLGIIFHSLQKLEKNPFTSIAVEGKIIDVLSFTHRTPIAAISVPGLYAYMINGRGECHLTLENMIDKPKSDSTSPLIPWMAGRETFLEDGNFK